MYTDEADITAHNVLYLLAAARKYLVDLLADKCTSFLDYNIDNNNVLRYLTTAYIKVKTDW